MKAFRFIMAFAFAAAAGVHRLTEIVDVALCRDDRAGQFVQLGPVSRHVPQHWKRFVYLM